MFRKFNADQLFTGTKILDDGYVLICRPDGTVEDIVKKEDAGSGIEYFKGVLTPGFINCHCHIDLSHLKGVLSKGTGLVDFLQGVMRQREVVSEQERNKAMFLAMSDMHKAGIVAVGDICTGEVSVEAKKFTSLFIRNFIEVTGFPAVIAESRFSKAVSTKDGFKKSLPHFPSQIAPHAPYSVSAALMDKINECTSGDVITIHNEESKEEELLFRNKSGGFLRMYENFGIDISDFSPPGSSSLMYWLSRFNNQQTILSVHNTFVSKEDLDYVKSRMEGGLDFYFCLCPAANLYIEKTLPPVAAISATTENIVLGTDSLASNDSLSILKEVKILHAQVGLPLVDLLKWATLNGARALRIDDKYGSFEKGKQPGVIWLKGDQPSEYSAERVL